MTTALIFAGGAGERMNTSAKPKQFLELYGKPIIIYTLEHFEAHPEVYNILVVCIENWIQELRHQLRLYAFEKVSQVIPGGESGQESIFKGLHALSGVCKENDIVLIHDGVRPLINGELIKANIAAAKKFGVSITTAPVTESVVRQDKSKKVTEVPTRAEMHLAKAPQTFRYGLIWELYQRANKDGISVIDSSHLCSLYGVEMHSVESTPNNIKITAPADYYIFRALYEAMENQQIIGL
jgi:2-C-methyl-D-erythritol 4-phosphate cytidylyltransferase